jgi:tricorn protease interacting factor F2/3
MCGIKIDFPGCSNSELQYCGRGNTYGMSIRLEGLRFLLDLERYDLKLDIDFYALTFRGHETIHIRQQDQGLVLDSLGLKITNVRSRGTSLPFEEDQKNARLVIRNLPKADGSITIEIDYEGKVSEETLYGVYKSRFGSDYFVTTDFEPNGARMLFPCIDNPSYKSVFNLVVTTQKNLSVVSNTEVRSVKDLGDRNRFTFAETPKMSSYIFYLGIGKFEQEIQKSNQLEIMVEARPGYAAKGKFALENTVKYLSALEDFYSIPYPLGKLDLIALPEYASGAMENWGAITFRESALLIDENSSFSNHRRVALVLGHELAHQWFGNLVTMKWWNDLWLNESFATFMERKMTMKLYPEWDELSGFLLESTTAGMLGDSMQSTHPIDAVVNTPEEISQIFDEISYEKGASVLLMINDYIGEKPFRNGVSRYLSEFKYCNARGNDLWKKLEQASGLLVSRVMESWISKPGFPFVTVSTASKKLVVKQQRFFLDSRSDSADKELWPIPITLLINGRTENFLMDEREVTRPLPEEVKQIKLNLGQTGFYRVLYDEYLYSTISNHFDSFNQYDRWGILSDLFAFLEVGKVSRDRYFRFVQRCNDSSEYLVVSTVADQLSLLHRIIPDDSSVTKAYVKFCSRQMERLGLDEKQGEKGTDKILREKITTALAHEDSKFASMLSSKFSNYGNLDPNLRSAVAVGFAQTRGSEGYDDLVSMMKKMDNEADIIKIYRGLTSFKDPELVKRALDFCLSGEVSRADSLYAIGFTVDNPHASEVLWNWLTTNLPALRELFKGTPYVGDLFHKAVPFVGLGREKELRDYFSANRIEEAISGISKGLELLRVYSDLRTRFRS